MKRRQEEEEEIREMERLAEKERILKESEAKLIEERRKIQA